jgi:hypothetical protein
MIPKDLAATIEADLEAKLPTLISEQQKYLAANGRYTYTPFSHTKPPEDGTAVKPDARSVKLGSKAETLAKLGIADEAMPYSLAIHEYANPELGRGFYAVARVVVGKVAYQRTKNVGPDASFESDWQEVAT